MIVWRAQQLSCAARCLPFECAESRQDLVRAKDILALAVVVLIPPQPHNDASCPALAHPAFDDVANAKAKSFDHGPLP